MPTAFVDSAPLQFSELTETMLTKLHDTKWLDRFRKCHVMSERIALLRTYNVQDQAEEHVIQYLIDKFDPPRSSVTYESQVREELERLEKNGEVIKTPETEQEWEKKLEEARLRDAEEERKTIIPHLENIRKIFPAITEDEFYGSIWKTDKVVKSKTISSEKENIQSKEISSVTQKAESKIETPLNLPPGAQSLESSVTTISGIGEASGERLNAAGVYTVKDFMNLTFEQASVILKTPLGAIPFKNYFRKEPLPQVV